MNCKIHNIQVKISSQQRDKAIYTDEQMLMCEQMLLCKGTTTREEAATPFIGINVCTEQTVIFPSPFIVILKATMDLMGQIANLVLNPTSYINEGHR